MKSREFEKNVNTIIKSDPFEFWKLQDVVLSHMGLKYQVLRTRVWPKLVGIEITTESVTMEKEERRSKKLKEFDIEQIDQIEKDVSRSMWKHKDTFTEEEFSYKRKQLSRLIQGVFVFHKNKKKRYYYQGFHDVTAVFLLVIGEYSASIVLDRLVSTYLHDFVATNRMKESTSVLRLIDTLVKFEAPVLSKFMVMSETSDGGYALPWVLTWFSYVVTDLDLISRIFDLLLCSHPLMPIYISASYVLSKKSDILGLPCDFPSVYSFLNRFPLIDNNNNVETVEEAKELMIENLEKIIQNAMRLYEKIPPKDLVGISKKVKITKCFLDMYPYFYHKNRRARPKKNPVRRFVESLSKTRANVRKRSKIIFSKERRENLLRLFFFFAVFTVHLLLQTWFWLRYL